MGMMVVMMMMMMFVMMMFVVQLVVLQETVVLRWRGWRKVKIFRMNVFRVCSKIEKQHGSCS